MLGALPRHLAHTTFSAVTVAPYERVIEHSVQYTRPVVILGPLSELVIARLAKEHPNTFQVCQLRKLLIAQLIIICTYILYTVTFCVQLHW